MLSIKNNLQVIAASYNNFLGWTITKSTDLHDRDELLIYPKSESDFRPINENDLSNKKDGIHFYSLEEILNELQKYKEFDIDYTGRIKVYVWKGGTK